MKVLGTTDEHSGRCDCCSTRIKRAVVLQGDTGEILRYGTTCAALATGYLTREIKRRAERAGKYQIPFDRLPAHEQDTMIMRSYAWPFMDIGE